MPHATRSPRQSRAFYSFAGVLGSSSESEFTQRAFSQYGPSLAFSQQDESYVLSAAVPVRERFRIDRFSGASLPLFSAKSGPGLSVEFTRDFAQCNVYPSQVRLRGSSFFSSRLERDVAAYPDEHTNTPLTFVRRLATTAAEIAIQNTAPGTLVIAPSLDGYAVLPIESGVSTGLRVFSNPAKRRLDALANILQLYSVFHSGRPALSEKQLLSFADSLSGDLR